MGVSYLVELLTNHVIGVIDKQGRPLPGMTTVQKAAGLVHGGRAVIRGPNQIQLLWNRGEFVRYVLWRDGYICQYCGRPGYTVEHIVPRSRGGLSTPANCRCACILCNGLKRDRTLEEFQDYILSQPCQCHTDSNWVRHMCYKHQVLERIAQLLVGFHGQPIPGSRPTCALTKRRSRRRRRRSRSAATAAKFHV